MNCTKYSFDWTLPIFINTVDPTRSENIDQVEKIDNKDDWNLSHRKEDEDYPDSTQITEEPKLENIINYCELKDFEEVEKPTEPSNTDGQNTEEPEVYDTGCEVDDDCQKGEVCKDGECGMFYRH